MAFLFVKILSIFFFEIFSSCFCVIFVFKIFSIFPIYFSKPISFALSNISESIPESGIIGVSPISNTRACSFLIIYEGNISGDRDNEINEIFSFSAIFERTSVKTKIFEVKLLFISTLQKSISDCTCSVLGIILFSIFTKLTKSEYF